MEKMVEHIEETRLLLGYDKIAVLGFSGFGMLALEYARKYSENVSYIILVSAIADLRPQAREKIAEFFEYDASEERKEILRINEEKLTDDMLKKYSPKRAMELLYINRAPIYWYNPNYDASWVWEGVEYNIEAFLHYFNTIQDKFDFTENFQEITQPVFLGLGRYDYVAPYILWDDLKNNIPNLTYVLFRKSGHWAMVEEQTFFDEKLIEWIKNTNT